MIICRDYILMCCTAVSLLMGYGQPDISRHTERRLTLPDNRLAVADDALSLVYDADDRMVSHGSLLLGTTILG